ncbi:MaoC family dehydratase [Sphingomonas sp. MG17]|uniref:MaoC family dehydratase n=1 Tax=Sphingomonas tagetis TaxID=2949092 RepID=A0A9X2HRH6_9SPHN|nr:MaoC family dehydratase [Sphingomonas tagetis]MCP3732244.1 MaoC family dehydratase [Sphingomonas tagetis]
MADTITIKALAQQGNAERVSEWVNVTQAMIDKFAEATGDHQFIHIDSQAAALTPFGGTIAHGFLMLSLMPLLRSRVAGPAIEGVKMAVNYGGNRVRFMMPVRSGKRVRGLFRTIELLEKHPGQWQQTVEFTVEIEGEVKPALIAEWITLIFV